MYYKNHEQEKLFTKTAQNVSEKLPAYKTLP